MGYCDNTKKNRRTDRRMAPNTGYWIPHDRPISNTAAAEVRRKYPRRSKTGAGIAQEAAQESASGQESAPESARNRRRYRPGARSGIELRIGQFFKNHEGRARMAPQVPPQECS